MCNCSCIWNSVSFVAASAILLALQCESVPVIALVSVMVAVAVFLVVPVPVPLLGAVTVPETVSALLVVCVSCSGLCMCRCVWVVHVCV